LVSPVILAAAARAIYDLIAAGVQGNRPKFIKIEKALAAGTKWQRQDIYLTYKDGARADWIGLWKRFLERGFLLPPSPMEPLILPAMLSAGEEAKLADLLLNS
ncbi:MAG: hypothetical protein FWF22_09145, partial [Treponema sp.]|nr:hypothetical protein [Treponema sp.]